MARFHALTVTDVRKTTRDAVVITLRPDEPSAFAFQAGQYLTFRRSFGGEELRRSYSICAGADDGVLQVGVKRVEGGAFSTWANEALRPGAVLESMPPMGAFHTPLDGTTDRHFIGFAGGSGITPVLSLMRTALSRSERTRFTLVYANRAPTTIMFREEIEDLKNRFMNRFSVIHILESDAQEIDLFTGRVDEAKCDALFARWIDIGSIDMAFICGPEPMMLAIARALRAHGLGEERIKYELFASAQPGRARRKAVSTAAAGAGAARATIVLDGHSRTVDLAPGQALLDAALGADLDAPFACRAGVCSTCRARVLEGEAEMEANHALEDYEVARGYVLTCQARAISERIVVDYDQ